jgi:hypothetical protein
MARLMVVLATSFLTSVPLAFAAKGDFPVGAFAAKIADENWTITFDDKGRFNVTHEGKEVVEGTYKVKKGEIELTDVKGEYAGGWGNEGREIQVGVGGQEADIHEDRRQKPRPREVLDEQSMGHEVTTLCRTRRRT